MIILVMGVSGSGKSTIGLALAAALGWRYLDADDFHPPENVAKMAAGVPLDDADRAPWLEKMNQALVAIDSQGASAVLGCSALKETYRKKLRAGLTGLAVVYLRGDAALIRERVGARQHRYMPASLLDSQFAALEAPADAIAVDVAQPVEDSVAEILARLPARPRP
jgi:carbohydrate kinase (thermoresistant glucokinase family)